LARVATSGTEPMELGLNDSTTLSMLAPDQPASRSYQYKAFISYSHDADSQLARSLQGGLHRFAKPWYRRRAIRVFRDETNLNVNPKLWSTIKEALGNAEYFLYLASPRAAASPWVQPEIGYLIDNRPIESFLIVLTE